MSPGVRYAVGAVLTLSAMEVVLSSTQATGRVSGLMSGMSKVVAYIMSPAVPLIPDRSAPAASTAPSAAPTATPTAAAPVTPVTLGAPQTGVWA